MILISTCKKDVLLINRNTASKLDCRKAEVLKKSKVIVHMHGFIVEVEGVNKRDLFPANTGFVPALICEFEHGLIEGGEL